MALFARMDTIAVAVAFAVVFAIGRGTATAVLLLQGAPEGVPIGGNLSALKDFPPGYSVTWPGVLIGAAWAGPIGAILGFVLLARKLLGEDVDHMLVNTEAEYHEEKRVDAAIRPQVSGHV